MLEQLIVRNFGLSAENTIEFKGGMTAITGETGAGKSLTVDALSQVLGERANTQAVREGAERAEIEAVFGEDGLSEELKTLLKDAALASDDGALVLRRVLGADGKSRAFVNGHAANLSQLRDIGAALISVHGQHASVRLADPHRQLELLDGFGGLEEKLKAVREAFTKYNAKRQELQKLADEQRDGAAAFKEERADLELLRQLDLSDGDYEALSSRYDSLMHAEETDQAAALALAALSDDEHNVIDVLDSRLRDLEGAAQYDHERLDPIIESFTAGLEKLAEARDALASYAAVSDPALSKELSDKLEQCHDLARRFRTEPGKLWTVAADLEGRLGHFLSLKEAITKLTSEVKTLRAAYEEAAEALSKARAEAASSMGEQVTALIRTLAMPDGVFKVQVICDRECRPRRDGRDECLFLFSANLGQQPRALGEVASGGELSRLALAIEVLTSGRNSTPTLIFDEVDTGISGRTASAVGDLLKKLGQRVQVLCVTHLPQVAAAARQQLLVTKENTRDGVISRIRALDEQGRVDEISRMMGGSVVTEATRQGALALLRHGADDAVSG